MSDDVIVAGTADDRLLVRGQVGCGPTNSLVSYDPTANTATVLFRPAGQRRRSQVRRCCIPARSSDVGPVRLGATGAPRYGLQ